MERFFSKSELKVVLEPIVYDRMSDGVYPVFERDARCFVTWNRLDLGFKKIFLELMHKNRSLAEDVYFNDIRSHSMGEFIEPGKPEKSGFDNYCACFDNVFQSILLNGFDGRQGLVPLASDGSIINGAHRTVSALHQGGAIGVCMTGLPPLICDYSYFFDRAVPVDYLEWGVLKLVESGEDFYLAFLWPSGKDNWDRSLALFDNVAYRKSLVLTLNGALNLLYECYGHMDWVGGGGDNFSGLRQKLIECFPGLFEVELIVFQNRNGVDSVRKIKEAVRDINGIGFSSIHITDTKEEAFRIGSFLLNENGLHYLNYSRALSFVFRKKFIDIKQKLLAAKIDLSDVVVDGSSVLELYGLRESQDVDVLFSDSVSLEHDLYFDNDDGKLGFHGLKKEDLLYNPKYYFIVDGVKVISFCQIRNMKYRRGEAKDKIDLEIMQFVGGGGNLRKLIVYGSQKIFYAKLKTRHFLRNFLIKLLAAVGLYSPVRTIYRKIMRRGD